MLQCGIKVPVPPGYNEEAGWKFLHNYSETKAVLTDGESSCNVAVRFQTLEVKFHVDVQSKLGTMEESTGEGGLVKDEAPMAVLLDAEPDMTTPTKTVKRSRLVTAGRAPPKPPAAS